MQEDENNGKIFYSLMQRIGADHRYQKILLIIWIFVGFTIGSTTFSPPFLLLQTPYTCLDLPSKDCQKFVCTLPPFSRSQYLKEHASSLATSLGDYHCQNKHNIVKAEAFIYIGGIAGVLAGAFLISCLTKKAIFILTTFMTIVGVSIAFFSVNLYMASVGLFINYASKCVQIELIYCYINETVDEAKRGKHQTLIFMFQALGSAMNGPVIYLLGSWKIFLIGMYIVPSILLLFCLFFFIHQTVYDSIIYKQTEQSLEIIQKVAKVNGTSDSHLITLEEIKLIKESFLSLVQGQEETPVVSHQKASIVDLFYYKSIRSKILLIIFLGLFVQFNFDGPELMITQFSMSVYMNGFILGISEVFSCVVGYLMVDEFQRKKMIFISTIIGICIGIPLIFVADCRSTCTEFQTVFQTVGLFAFRMAMSFTFTTFILTQYQLFPTQVRGMAVNVVASTGYIAVSMIPVVSKLLLKTFNISVVQFYVFNCVCILILAYFVPETYNNLAPDMIEELQENYEEIDDNLIVKTSNSAQQKSVKVQ